MYRTGWSKVIIYTKKLKALLGVSYINKDCRVLNLIIEVSHIPTYNTVQFNYNFTHVRDSTHGNMTRACDTKS